MNRTVLLCALSGIAGYFAGRIISESEFSRRNWEAFGKLIGLEFDGMEEAYAATYEDARGGA